MNCLIPALSRLPELQTLRSAWQTGALPVAVTGVSAIHKAALAYVLLQSIAAPAGPMLFLAADEAEAQRIVKDLASFGLRTLFYPSRDFNFREMEGASREYEHQRLQTLCRLLDGQCDCVVSCIDAACQYTLPKQALDACRMPLKTGQCIPLEHVLHTLSAGGYERAEQIDGPGQFAHRGGILDCFPPDAAQPVRIEFFGDEIDSISSFDVQTQRRTDPLDTVILSPAVEAVVPDPQKLGEAIRQHAASLRGKTAAKAKEILLRNAEALASTGRLACADKFLPLLFEKPATLWDYFPSSSPVCLSEIPKIKERMRTTQWQWAQDCQAYLEEGVLCRGLDTYLLDWTQAAAQIASFPCMYLDTFVRGSTDVPVRTLINLTARQLSLWGGSLPLLVEDLRAMAMSKTGCLILAGNGKTGQNLAAQLREEGIAATYADDPADVPPGSVIVTQGGLTAGMEFPGAHFAVISHGHMLTPSRRRAQKKKSKHTQELYSLSELSPGDYVVHTTHGIGVFQGIHKIDMQGVVKDYIKVQYAKKDTLYVPVTQLDLVAKYIGPREDSLVRLSRLGGSEWQKSKARVRSAVKDMARELIQLYAQRIHQKGHAFSPDGEWQRDFESHFPFEETEDQLRCVEEIKQDMEQSAPMDRLLCGDVGFGKTEVALRAAFKCVTDSKQCALLVPTTILAWQHYQTICKRMEGFPVTVELLSRFRSPKQQDDILKKLERGEIDFIVGTHRLVSKDVKFHDLGLVIIDEEQRFGVAQKEKLKDVCKNVDVLTLSATPIPRTLNMALSGIRDMSVIEEAPQDRYPVQTYVLEYDAGVIADAIRRELRRGGQVYYLHNNVESISRIAAGLQQELPDVRIGTAHGKMNEAQLSEVWGKLIEHEIDVLVCTTIIETGVDVPNVNTLIIDQADRMGLSQLHQIRGRVGRSSRRAYAYFTFSRNKILSEIAQKRLSAIREFTEFGSGFKIAMRDLEIRGAGNILGGEQHGHMETVGYDMYLKLLDEAIRLEKGEAPPPADAECLVDLQVQAHIPERYIESLPQRLEIYRRIAGIRSGEDASDVIDELIDRFGEPPSSVQGLIDVALLRNMAASLGFFEVKQQGSSILLYPHQIQMEHMKKLTQAMPGKVLLNGSSKPYLSIRLPEGRAPLEILQQVFAVLQKS